LIIDLILRFGFFPCGKHFNHSPQVSFLIFAHQVAVESKDHHHVEEVNDDHFVGFVVEDFEELDDAHEGFQNEFILDAAIVVDGILALFDVCQDHLESQHVFLFHSFFSRVQVLVTV
jgi:hypothetical protein